MPSFNDLHLALARQINDPAAAAGTDGKVISSARRTDILNQAIREFIGLQVRVIEPAALYARILNVGALSNYLKQESKVLVSNATTLSGFTGGLAWIVSIRNTTNTATVEPLSQTKKSKVQAGDNRYLAPSTRYQLYVIEDGNILVVGSGATDTIAVQYIKQHTDLAVGGTILIPSEYHYEILDLSVARALEEKPTAEHLARAITARQRVYSKYGV